MAVPARKSALYALTGLLASTLLLACGTNMSGMSGASSSPAPSGPSVNSVSASCTPSTLAPGATSQCTANVQGTGTYNSSVKWSASEGTITATGLFTAPASGGDVTVTATSTENPAVSSLASVTVQSSSSPAPSSVSSVAISCAPAALAPGATSQCTANVQGTGTYNSSVKWSASEGTITATGLFTAPSSAGNVTVTATSVQNSAVSSQAAIAVQSKTSSTPSSVSSVAVSCSPATLAPGATSQCSAKVQGTGSYSSAVKWSASAGTINSSGLFTAPSSAGNITVTATSVQDPAVSSLASIAVQANASSAPPSVSSVVLSCAPATLAPGANSQCSAKVQGTGSYNSAVKWSASAGTINSNGLFTAPSSAANITITATSVQNSAVSSHAAITVQSISSPAISSVTMSCTPTALAPGATSQCSAKVQGTGSYNSAVKWSASAGTITSAGLFTAPTSAGNITVTATSVQTPSKSASQSLSVQSTSAISSVSVSCTPATLAPGATSQCSAKVQGTGSYNSAVKWSASAGTITSAGLFTAPTSAGNITVTATSVQTPSKSASQSLSVQSTSAISSVSVSCTPATLAPGATSQCSAKVQGTGSYNSAVKWSASAGSITTAGLFTAPGSAGKITITATSVQDSTRTASQSIEVSQPTTAVPHVVMVMEENSEYSTVVGSGNWPNLNSLIRNGALATHYYANTHPSIGNYLMLTTGQVLTNNDDSTQVWNVDNIARRMLAAGVSFRIYAEGITQGYVGGNTGAYLIRHDPFALLSDIANNPTVANEHLFPFTQFATDVANGNLPEFSFIVPDVNDDAHNGTPQQADYWLQTKVVEPLSNDAAFQPNGDGVLIVDFDEGATSDTTYGGGKVSPVFWGPKVKTGYTQQSSTVYQHPSMLRTVMQLLGLSNPPGAAASAPPMSEFFK